MKNDSATRRMLQAIVAAAFRRPNRDGSIQPRDYDYQLVPTVLIEQAEHLLAERHEEAQ